MIAKTLKNKIIKCTEKVIIHLYQKYGYPIKTFKGAVNVFGIRSNTIESNNFDDFLGILHYLDTKPKLFIYPGTTDPGTPTLLKPINPNGTAILVPGYYDVYILGKHQGLYDALIQRRGPVQVYRDNNKNEILDRGGNIFSGWFGINIHRANQKGITKIVGSFSAGCQVFQDAKDFDQFIDIIKKSISMTGKNEFAYALFTEDQLDTVFTDLKI